MNRFWRSLQTLLKHSILIAVALMTIGPLYFVLVTSLKTNEEFYNNVWRPGSTLHLENYVLAWDKGHMGQYLLNSLQVVSASVILVVTFGLLAGYALARLRVPGSRGMVTILASTLMIPAEATLVPLFAFMASLGLLNTKLNLIFVYVGWSMALTTYLFRNYFLSLPEELADAARIDGCTESQIFRKVMVPLSLPAIATAIILNFLFIWGEFLWVLISTRSDTVRTIPLGLFRFQSQFGTDWVQLSAAISISILPLIIVFIAFQRYFLAGLTAGALKG